MNQPWKRQVGGLAVLSLVGLIVIPACGMASANRTGTSVSGPTMTLRLCSVLPPTDPSNIGLNVAAKDLEQSTGGKLKLVVYPSGQLGTLTGCFNELKGNTIQMMNQDPTTTTALLPEAGVFAAPFQFRSYAAEVRAWNSPAGQKIEKAFENKAGVHLLQPMQFGVWELYSVSKPIRSCSDLKGLRVRVPASTALTAFFTQCGAIPVSEDISQAALGLQTHAVAAIPLPVQVLVGDNMQSLVHYATQLGFLHDVLQPIVNNQTWNAMSSSERSALVAAINKGIKVDNGLEAAAAEAAQKKLGPAGVQTVTGVNIKSFETAAQREVQLLSSQWGGASNVRALIAAGKG